ncbi:MAG: guanylate kinase, partial [Bacteroidota bacterium]
LRSRSTEVEHQLQERLNKAEFELGYEKDYDVVVVNDKLDETFQRCETLVDAFIAAP